MGRKCQEHQNDADRICLIPTCKDRLMCLLCDHEHLKLTYSKFKQTISGAIDDFLMKKQDSEGPKIQQQKKRIEQYIFEIKSVLTTEAERVGQAAIQQLQAEEQELIKQIKKARISQQYAEASRELFGIFLRIHKGQSIDELFKNNDNKKIESITTLLKDFHEKIFSIFKSSKRIQIPDLAPLATLKCSPFQNPSQIVAGFQKPDIPRIVPESRLLFQTKIDMFDSLISDCIESKRRLYVSSYDKKIRLLDSSLMLIGELQFGNIITCMANIGADAIAIGVSKQIEICAEVERQIEILKPIMRLTGHKERVGNLSNLNSRILASSSADCIKIWDLYYEKCVHTFDKSAGQLPINSEPKWVSNYLNSPTHICEPTCIDFLQQSCLGSECLITGWNTHQLKVFCLETHKCLRRYQLEGVPLCLGTDSPGNLIYVGGLPGYLMAFDLRSKQVAWKEMSFKEGLTQILKKSADMQDSISIVGDREGWVYQYEVRRKNFLNTWQAHVGKTNLRKPNGIVKITTIEKDKIVTAGANDRSVKAWSMSF